ncbi:MAG: bifunctional DNA primase/polymerase [Myxococcota bacterium]
MVHLHTEELLFAEHLRFEDALDAFWRAFVYLPEKQKHPGRQYIKGPLDERPVWTTNSHDHQRALQFTPGVFLGALDEEHLVELPALWASVYVGSDDVAAATRRLSLLVDHYGVPEPHYVLYADEHLYPVWRIEPLRRPGKNAPLAHTAAFKQCVFAWRMARKKLALAFGQQLDDTTPVAELLPMPQPSSRSEYIGSDAYIVEARHEAPMLRIRDVSGPLAGFDEPSFLALRPHEKRRPRYLSPRDAWITSPAFLKASEPKKSGERHPAAVTLTCILRWADWSREDITKYLHAWHSRNVDQSAFPYKRLATDELEDLVEWAFEKLVPGGPNERSADVRGRYTQRQEAIAAVLGFLSSQEAEKAPWYGTQPDLAHAASLFALDRGQAHVKVTRDSLQKLLDELGDRGVLRVVEREGKTWITRWHLRESYAVPPQPSDAALSVFADRGVAAPGGVFESDVSERQSCMSIRLSDFDLADGQEPLGIESPQTQIFQSCGSGDPGPEPSPTPDVRSQKPSESAVPSTQEPALPDDAEPGRPFEKSWGAGAGVDAVRHESTETPESLGAAKLWGSAREAALALCRLGFSVIPLRPRGKEPLGRWTAAQRRRASEDELALVFDVQPDSNFAVVCGAVSGLVVVDLDDEEAVAFAEANLPPTPLVVTTSRGQHWYYLHPGGDLPTFRPEGLKIDVKGDGGYVVGPGSLHPSGAMYQATSRWSAELVRNAPLFDAAWFGRQVRTPASATAAAPASVSTPAPAPLTEADARVLELEAFRKIREAVRRGNFTELRNWPGPKGES